MQRSVSPAGAPAQVWPVYDMSGALLGYAPLAPGASMLPQAGVPPMGAPTTAAHLHARALKAGHTQPSDQGSPAAQTAAAPSLNSRSPMPTPSVRVLDAQLRAGSHAVAHLRYSARAGNAAAPEGSPAAEYTSLETIVDQGSLPADVSARIAKLESELAKARDEAERARAQAHGLEQALTETRGELMAVRSADFLSAKRRAFLTVLDEQEVSPLVSLRGVPSASVVSALACVPVLMGLPTAVLREIERAGRLCYCAAGEKLVEIVGQDAVALVLHGQARSEAPRVVVQAGAMLGATALLGRRPASELHDLALWTAVEDVVLFVCPCAPMRRLLLNECYLLDEWSSADLAWILSPAYTPLSPSPRLHVHTSPAYTALMDRLQQLQKVRAVVRGEVTLASAKLALRRCSNPDATLSPMEEVSAVLDPSLSYALLRAQDTTADEVARAAAAACLGIPHAVSLASPALQHALQLSQPGVPVHIDIELLFLALCRHFGCVAGAFYEVQTATLSSNVSSRASTSRSAAHLYVRLTTPNFCALLGRRFAAPPSMLACINEGRCAWSSVSAADAWRAAWVPSEEPLATGGGLGSVAVHLRTFLNVPVVLTGSSSTSLPGVPPMHSRTVYVMQFVNKTAATAGDVPRLVLQRELHMTGTGGADPADLLQDVVVPSDVSIASAPVFAFHVTDASTAQHVAHRISDCVQRVLRQVALVWSRSGMARNEAAASVERYRAGLEHPRDDAALLSRVLGMGEPTKRRTGDAEAGDGLSRLRPVLRAEPRKVDAKPSATDARAIVEAPPSTTLPALPASRCVPAAAVSEQLQWRVRSVAAPNASAHAAIVSATILVNGVPIAETSYSRSVSFADGTALWKEPAPVIIREDGSGSPSLTTVCAYDTDDGRGWMDTGLSVADCPLDAQVVFQVVLSGDNDGDNAQRVDCWAAFDVATSPGALRFGRHTCALIPGQASSASMTRPPTTICGVLDFDLGSEGAPFGAAVVHDELSCAPDWWLPLLDAAQAAGSLPPLAYISVQRSLRAAAAQFHDDVASSAILAANVANHRAYEDTSSATAHDVLDSRKPGAGRVRDATRAGAHARARAPAPGFGAMHIPTHVQVSREALARQQGLPMPPPLLQAVGAVRDLPLLASSDATAAAPASNDEHGSPFVTALQRNVSSPTLARADTVQLALFVATRGASLSMQAAREVSTAFRQFVWEARWQLLRQCGNGVLPFVIGCAPMFHVLQSAFNAALQRRQVINLVRACAPLPQYIAADLLTSSRLPTEVLPVIVAAAATTEATVSSRLAQRCLGAALRPSSTAQCVAAWITSAAVSQPGVVDRAVLQWCRVLALFPSCRAAALTLSHIVLDSAHVLRTSEQVLNALALDQVVAAVAHAAQGSASARAAPSVGLPALLRNMVLPHTMRLPLTAAATFEVVPALYYVAALKDALGPATQLVLTSAADGGGTATSDSDDEGALSLEVSVNRATLLQDIEDAVAVSLHSIGVFSDRVALNLPLADEEDAAPASGHDVSGWLRDALPASVTTPDMAQPQLLQYPQRVLAAAAAAQQSTSNASATLSIPRPVGVALPSSGVCVSGLEYDMCELLETSEDCVQAVLAFGAAEEPDAEQDALPLDAAEALYPDAVRYTRNVPRPIRFSSNSVHVLVGIRRPRVLLDEEISATLCTLFSQIWREAGFHVGDAAPLYAYGCHAVHSRHPALAAAHTRVIGSLDGTLSVAEGVDLPIHHTAVMRGSLRAGEAVGGCLSSWMLVPPGMRLLSQVLSHTHTHDRTHDAADSMLDVHAARQDMHRWITSHVFDEARLGEASDSSAAPSDDAAEFASITHTHTRSLVALLAAAYVLGAPPCSAHDILLSPAGHVMWARPPVPAAPASSAPSSSLLTASPIHRLSHTHTCAALLMTAGIAPTEDGARFKASPALARLLAMATTACLHLRARAGEIVSALTSSHVSTHTHTLCPRLAASHPRARAARHVQSFDIPGEPSVLDPSLLRTRLCVGMSEAEAGRVFANGLSFALYAEDA